VDIRSEGSLTGDVITQRISVEDGAILKGSVQVRAVEQKQPQSKQAVHEQSKAAAAVAGA
jgi:cytoskeletal protein CcmA (bactofilin family)